MELGFFEILSISLGVITLFLAYLVLGYWKRFKAVDLWEDPKTKEKVELEPVYRDKFGNNWYQYKNPRALPYSRGVVAEIAIKQAELNITKPKLLEYFDLCETLANQGKISKMLQRFENMRERLTWACEEETLKGVALVYFVMEGEDPTSYSDEWGARKLEIFEKDEEARYFFLAGAYSTITGLSNTSDQDIRRYLAGVKLKDTI
jgi:hypothetical protein